jgi:hypothetical protein
MLDVGDRVKVKEKAGTAGNRLAKAAAAWSERIYVIFDREADRPSEEMVYSLMATVSDKRDFDDGVERALHKTRTDLFWVGSADAADDTAAADWCPVPAISPHHWCVFDVVVWFEQHRLGVCRSDLVEDQVDGELMLQLDHQMLLELGVTRKIKRTKILTTIEKLVAGVL